MSLEPIKICENNKHSINQILGSVNGQAIEHAFATFEDIQEVVKTVEALALQKVALRKNLPGTKATITSGLKRPKFCAYRRLATCVTIEHRTSGWYLARVRQAFIYANGGGQARLSFSSKQDEVAVALFRSGYECRSAAA